MDLASAFGIEEELKGAKAKLESQVYDDSVTIPKEFLDFIEEEKAGMWAEAKVISFFYRMLRQGGVPESAAKDLTVLRLQYLLFTPAGTGEG